MLPLWFKREIHPGDSGPDVRAVKRILGLDYDSEWNADSQTLLRGYYGVDVITAEIAEQIGEAAATAEGLPPLWYTRDLQIGDYGDDVDAVRKILGLKPGIYDTSCFNAVKRFEGNHGINPTGVVTESLALIMGEVE